MALVQGADQTLVVRIAIFRNDLTVVDPSRYNSQEIGLARGLAHAGHDVDIYTIGRGSVLGDTPIKAPPERSIRMRFIKYRKLPVLEAPVFPGIYRLLIDEPYDIVQINDEGSVAARLIGAACVASSTPFVLYQGMYKVLSGRSFALFERFHALTMRPWLRRNAHRVFAKTNVAAHFLEERGYEDVRVLPVGLDQSPFEQRTDRDWRRELGLPDDALLLAYVGELEPRRKPDLLVDVLSQLDSRFHLIVVGDGSGSALLLDAASKRIPGRLFSIGRLLQSELPSIYEQSLMLLFPTTFEIYGMVLLEAMSFGLPSIASAAAGPSQMLDDTRLGLLIEGFDPAIWVSAVNLLAEAEFSANVTANKNHRRATACGRYSWEQIAIDWLRQL